MNKCGVCQKETSVDLVPIADGNTTGFLLVCSDCLGVHQEEHYEDIFRSPVDFELLNVERRLLRHVA